MLERARACSRWYSSAGSCLKFFGQSSSTLGKLGFRFWWFIRMSVQVEFKRNFHQLLTSMKFPDVPFLTEWHHHNGLYLRL